MKTIDYNRGYDWAVKELKQGRTPEEIDAQASMDDDFDRGARDATRLEQPIK